MTSSVAAGEVDSKPAWKWETGERIRERQRPEHAQKRREVAVADGRCAAGCQSDVIVDGRRNPELLTPSELMDTLSGAFDIKDAGAINRTRTLWMGRSDNLEHGPDFWDRLYTAGRPFFDAWREILRMSRVTPTEAVDRATLVKRQQEVEHNMCALRAEALTAARDTFGRDVFDEFLYRAVAPGVFVSETQTASSSATWIESGCR